MFAFLYHLCRWFQLNAIVLTLPYDEVLDHPSGTFVARDGVMLVYADPLVLGAVNKDRP